MFLFMGVIIEKIIDLLELQELSIQAQLKDSLDFSQLELILIPQEDN